MTRAPNSGGWAAKTEQSLSFVMQACGDKHKSNPDNSKLATYPRPAIALTAVTYLLGYLERLPGTIIPALLYFLLPVTPLGRKILLGLLMATLTLSSIFLASLLTGRFVPAWHGACVEWMKGLTRGIWEEVLFRGIVLVLLVRAYSLRKAVFFSTFLFAVVHLDSMAIDLEMTVEAVSIFSMELLFTYLVLKTGSPYRLSFFTTYTTSLLLVQNTAGADETLASAILYAFLWIALVIGALLTKYIVEHWRTKGSKTLVAQA